MCGKLKVSVCSADAREDGANVAGRGDGMHETRRIARAKNSACNRDEVRGT